MSHVSTPPRRMLILPTNQTRARCHPCHVMPFCPVMLIIACARNKTRPPCNNTSCPQAFSVLPSSVCSRSSQSHCNKLLRAVFFGTNDVVEVTHSTERRAHPHPPVLATRQRSPRREPDCVALLSRARTATLGRRLRYLPLKERNSLHRIHPCAT